nr:hypothetical protein [Tanacetum cinerariifolium]
MSTPTFDKTHNLIAFLEKPSESDGFKKIFDFLNANQIKYALTVVITEASIRHDLKLNDAEGTSCLPNAMIFEELARMGVVTPLFDIMMVQPVKEVGDLPTADQDTPIPDAPSSSQPQRKHKPMKKEKKEMKETEVSPTELPTEKNVPTPSSDLLLSENEVIEVKSSHKAKIAELESRMEKLEEENRSLTKELKSSISKVESPTVKETIVDKEKSSKQVRKIADINDDAEANLANVYNLDLAHEETILKVVKVITTTKLIVDEVSTVGGELNATDEEPVSTALTNITTAQPSEATKITFDISNAPKAQVKDKGKSKLVEEPKVLKPRKAQIAIDEEVARRIDAEWNA